MDALSYYLNNILAPRLYKYGVNEQFLTYTINSIFIQMSSLLRHWKDSAFKNTLLLIGLEEGSFYKPITKIDVRCFVVVTIRNSPIEKLHSCAFQESGLKIELTNNDIKEITSEAIRYFSKQDFNELSDQVILNTKYDLYYDLANKHPVAWTALQHLASMQHTTFDYQKISVKIPFNIKELDTESKTITTTQGLHTIKYDGFSEKIEPSLKEYLKMISSVPNGILIVDSFKSVTRNFSKLIDILEFLLSRNLTFVSTNYYLENGHVEKRLKVLRAGHTVHEIKYNLLNTVGIGYRHKAVLKKYAKQIK